MCAHIWYALSITYLIITYLPVSTLDPTLGGDSGFRHSHGVEPVLSIHLLGRNPTNGHEE